MLGRQAFHFGIPFCLQVRTVSLSRGKVWKNSSMMYDIPCHEFLWWILIYDNDSVKRLQNLDVPIHNLTYVYCMGYLYDWNLSTATFPHGPNGWVTSKAINLSPWLLMSDPRQYPRSPAMKGIPAHSLLGKGFFGVCSSSVCWNNLRESDLKKVQMFSGKNLPSLDRNSKKIWLK